MNEPEILICQNCQYELVRDLRNKVCSNCFACSGCEIYICPNCGEEIIVKPRKDFTRKTGEE